MIKKEKIKMPIDAVVAVTYNCNSRCVMCNIWQIKDFPEMPPEAYSKLPTSLKDINISGGEAFLRPDLVEIVKVIHTRCPRATLNISSNGFLVERMKTFLPQIKKIDPNIGLSISVDGVGEMHEKVRRIPQAWSKVVEVLRFSRDVAKIKRVKMAFTLNNMNAEHLLPAYEWSKKLGVDFTMAIAHDSEFYFSATDVAFKASHEEKIKKHFQQIINKMLKSLSPKEWVRAYFVDGLYKLSKGERRPLESYAGEDFFYLDPKGDVYPSVVDNVVMGNIFEYRNFESLWYSEKAGLARKAITGFENNYWMVCTARTAIRRNPLKVMNWIFKNKLSWRG